jgi:hypothetical protein
MLPIDATQYSYITCKEVTLPFEDCSFDSKLIHNNDVEFRLQQLQIAYPNKQFVIHKCTP